MSQFPGPSDQGVYTLAVVLALLLLVILVLLFVAPAVGLTLIALAAIIFIGSWLLSSSF